MTGASPLRDDHALVPSGPEPLCVSAHSGDGRWRVERIGRATLYLGDCREVLPTLATVDAVVTDPPYGIGESGGRNKSRARLATATEYDELDWDDRPIPADLMAMVRASAKWCIIFGGNYYDCPPAKCWLVWDKVNGASDFADCELAWTNLPKAARLIRYLWLGMIRERGSQRGDHPTQKPLEVMKWCIGHLPESSGTILDPFMGSGTTGVAALLMGRAFIGVEREERYFEAACRRLREANGDDQGPLFAPAQVDTHPKGGDNLLAPFMGSAVPAGDAPDA